MVNGQSQTSKIARWKMLEARLRDQLADQPHLVEAHAELQRLIAEGEELEVQFELRRVAFLDTSARRKAVVSAGEELRSRLAGALHFKLGAKSQALREYGLKPRRAGGKKKEPEGEVPAPTPPTAVPKALPAEDRAAAPGGTADVGTAT